MCIKWRTVLTQNLLCFFFSFHSSSFSVTVFLFRQPSAMFCPEVFYVTTTIFLAHMFARVRSEECRDIYSTYGMMLKGHIIKTMSTSSSLQCLLACKDDIRCQSFNYVMLQNICELNSLTKEASPKDFLPSSNRYYIMVKGTK